MSAGPFVRFAFAQRQGARPIMIGLLHRIQSEFLACWRRQDPVEMPFVRHARIIVRR
jgi:hypothetical protein